MAIKYVTAPESITMRNYVTDEPLLDAKGAPIVRTFREFVLGTLLNDRRCSQGWKAMNAAADIAKKVKADTREIALDGEEYEMLCAIIDTPQGAFDVWQPSALMQLRPFMAAIKEATKEPSLRAVAPEALTG